MTTPPPLPASPARTAPARDAAQGFVTGLAWITIAAGALGLGYALLQGITPPEATADSYLRLLDPLGTGQVVLPPLLRWSIDHTLAISLIQGLVSAPTLWLGWGLLRRREWARLGLIASLVVGAVLTFGLIWLVPALIEQMLSIQTGLAGAGQLPPELAGMTTVAMVFSAAIAVVFAGLHGWIVWKLRTAAVRAQFTSGT